MYLTRHTCARIGDSEVNERQSLFKKRSLPNFFALIYNDKSCSIQLCQITFLNIDCLNKSF